METKCQCGRTTFELSMDAGATMKSCNTCLEQNWCEPTKDTKALENLQRLLADRDAEIKRAHDYVIKHLSQVDQGKLSDSDFVDCIAVYFGWK